MIEVFYTDVSARYTALDNIVTSACLSSLPILSTANIIVA